MPTSAVIDRAKLSALRRREEARFAERTEGSAALLARARRHMPSGVPMAWMAGLNRFPPLFVTHGEGARFFDCDGNGYVDFNVGDLSMTMGYGCGAITEAVARQTAAGAHFLLPTEDAVSVSEELAARVGLPFWQFTLSASGANTEVLRIARFVTGRDKLVVFGGHYHGHIDETLVEQGEEGSEPGWLGLPAEAAVNTKIVPFNDLDELERALQAGDVALVLTEPALTNCNLIEPLPGFLEGMRDLTRRHGALLCYDEAHTFQFAHGGLVGAWRLDSDFVVLGKGLGTGISFALYSMTADIAAVVEKHLDSDIGPPGIATGGTTYASAVALAAAKAALFEVLVPAGYDRITALGARLADGLDHAFQRFEMPWRAFRMGPRSGFCLAPDLPRNIEEAQRSLDYDFIDTRRVFMANRGIWDAIASAGPQASFAHSEADIDHYVAAAADFLGEIMTS